MISICIPTYNRAIHLENCLNSILLSTLECDFEYEICVSDNGSTDNTRDVVKRAQLNMNINFRSNDQNIGISKNFIQVIEMAKGDFCWLLGDDDLLMPEAINKLNDLINKSTRSDFFYINSYYLTTEYVFSFDQPFDLNNLPEKMVPFSKKNNSHHLSFLELIDPKVSFDFLGGMFLSVFRRSMWIDHVDSLDKKAVADLRVFSHFDNTFPHLRIFAKAFSNSEAYFHCDPLSVNLSGAREWSPMYPFVHSVRLIEALELYRENGLPLWKFIKCKNFALNNFFPDLAYMIIHKNISGLSYVNVPKILISNCLYPNFYLSVVYFLIRKLKKVKFYKSKN